MSALSSLMFLSKEERQKAKDLATDLVEIQKWDPMKKVTLLFKDKPDRHYSGIESELVSLYEDDTSEITLSDLLNLS
jgi:phage-related protein